MSSILQAPAGCSMVGVYSNLTVMSVFQMFARLAVRHNVAGTLKVACAASIPGRNQNQSCFV